MKIIIYLIKTKTNIVVHFTNYSRPVSYSSVSRMSVRKKLVIVGDGCSGKTCLLMVFSQDQFPKCKSSQLQ